MSGLRFKVGELVLVVEADENYRPVAAGSIGIVESIGVVDTNGQFWDYGVDCPDDPEWVHGFRDHQLKRIDPPDDVMTQQTEQECEA